MENESSFRLHRELEPHIWSTASQERRIRCKQMKEKYPIRAMVSNNSVLYLSKIRWWWITVLFSLIIKHILFVSFCRLHKASLWLGHNIISYSICKSVYICSMSRARKQYTVCEAISPDKERIKGVVKWYDGNRVRIECYALLLGIWLYLYTGWDSSGLFCSQDSNLFSG